MKISRWVVALLVLVASSGQAQTAEPQPAAGTRDVVRPGDAITLRVFMEPEMTDTFRISVRGNVVLPRLGAVNVAGRSALVLQDSLRSALSEFLNNPAVEVTVLRRVGIIGEVLRPDVYLIDMTVMLREALTLAGGLTADANSGRIFVLRDGQRHRIAYSAGVMSEFPLKSGDQIVVERKSWLSRNLLGVTSTAAVAVSVILSIVNTLGQ